MGKQKLASKQYNSPMAMYSEDVLEEIMQQVVTQQQEKDTPRWKGEIGHFAGTF